MPLIKGSGKEEMDENFHEFRHGKTFKNTKAKFGKARAMKQMEAVILSKARKTGGRDLAEPMENE